MDYAALKAELAADPQARGYAALVAAGADAALAALLNDRAGGDTVIQEEVIASVLRAAIDPTDEQSLTAMEQQRLTSILTPGFVQLKNPNIRAALDLLFPSVTRNVTRQNIRALYLRPASRAELLFGQPVRPEDVALALRGVPVAGEPRMPGRFERRVGTDLVVYLQDPATLAYTEIRRRPLTAEEQRFLKDEGAL